MVVYYIGADVHSNNTELAIERDGRIVQRHSLPTSVRAIREVLASLQGVKHLTVEEGPLAGWLYRNLKDHVDTMVVCDPRRNRLITGGGDKDDRIDAAKLAALLRDAVRSVLSDRGDCESIPLRRPRQIIAARYCFGSRACPTALTSHQRPVIIPRQREKAFSGKNKRRYSLREMILCYS